MYEAGGVTPPSKTIEPVYDAIGLAYRRGNYTPGTARSTRQNASVGCAAVLPASALEGWDVVDVNCIAHTEIGNERPVWRDVERGRQPGGIEDRDPAESDALGAGGKPEGVDGEHGRVFDHFGHGAASESVALVGVAVGEDSEVDGGFDEAGELEAGVAGHAIGRLRGQGVGVTVLEVLADGSATGGVVDGDEAPRLAEADRRREGCLA